jgi:hypothetical protein
VKARNVRPEYVRDVASRSNVGVTPLDALARSPLSATVRQHYASPRTDGIEVFEDELGTVSAQRVYKMRCECGRSWFELELPKLSKCPACLRLNLVVAT